MQAGCGARSERRGDASDDAGAPSTAGTGGATGASSAGGTGGTAGLTSSEGILVIPVEARHTNSLALMLDDGPEVLGPALAHEVSLAFGSEYPKKVTFDLLGSFIFEEAGTLVDATSGLELTSATAVSAGITARRVDAKHFELEVQAEGNFSIAIDGTWSPSAADQPLAGPFSVEVLVRVHRVASAVLNACGASPRYVVSGAPFQRPYLQLYSAEGDSINPANASGTRSATISVHARAGTRLSAADGIGSLVAVGDEQTLSVRHGDTEIGSFELVPPARVDGLRTRFVERANWIRGVSELSSGSKVYLHSSSLEVGQVHAAPELFVGGVPVCTQIVPAWFDPRSKTPDVCPLVTPPQCDVCSENTLPEAVSIEELGTCQFVVDAPELNGGSGLSEELSIQVVPPN